MTNNPIPNIIDAELVDSLPSTVSDPLVVSTSMIAQANELHYEISSLESVIASAGMRSVLATLRLGYVLCRLKEETPHGEFSLFFSDEQRRLKVGGEANSNRSSNLKSNLNHGLNFSQQMATRYMSAYRKALAEYTSQCENQALLLSYLQSSDDAAHSKFEDIDNVLKVATKGAETPRQMMLNLDVIKSASRPKQSGHDPFHGKRNTKGGPRKKELSPEEAMRIASELAVDDLHEIGVDLQRFCAAGRLAIVPHQDLMTIRTLLRDVIRQIDTLNPSRK